MRKDKDDTPKCPPQCELPKPELIWQGTFIHLLDDLPCRVVLGYAWKLTKGASEWVAQPQYVYEIAISADAMGSCRYESAPLNELPAKFFEDVIDAFGSARAIIASQQEVA